MAITMAGLGARSARLAWCSSLTRPSVFSPCGVTSRALSRCLLLISLSLLGKSAGSGAVNGRGRIQRMISLGFGWESGCARGDKLRWVSIFNHPNVFPQTSSSPLFLPLFPFTFYFSADAQKCELICQSEGTGDVVFMNQVVHDGTRCSYRDPYSICVRGECVVRS